MKNFFKKMKDDKKFRTIMVTLIMILTIILLLIWGTVTVLDYKNLQKEYKESNEKYSTLINNYETLKKENTKFDAEIKELSQTEKQNEINEKINKLEGTNKKLEEEKQKLEEEIASLKEDAIKIKGEPKTYPAGYFTAGEDLPVGRYKIYGGSSNFVVHSSRGDLKVNIILGGRYGVDEYIYAFKTGDEIQSESSFKLIEIE